MERLAFIFDGVDRTGAAISSLRSGLRGVAIEIIAVNQAFQLIEMTGRNISKTLGALIRAGDEYTRLGILLKGTEGSVAGANARFQELAALTNRLPLSLDAVTASFVRLAATGVPEATRTIKAVADAVAAFGGTQQDFDLAMLAIQQMIGKGVVSMEELRRQLGERIPSAMKILARELGLTLPELFAKVQSGALNSAEAVAALTRGFERDFGGAAARMVETWTGATTKLDDAWKRFLNSIAKSKVVFPEPTSPANKTDPSGNVRETSS